MPSAVSRATTAARTRAGPRLPDRAGWLSVVRLAGESVARMDVQYTRSPPCWPGVHPRAMDQSVAGTAGVTMRAERCFQDPQSLEPSAPNRGVTLRATHRIRLAWWLLAGNLYGAARLPAAPIPA